MTVITWVYRIDQSVCQFERASKSSLLLHKRKSALSAHTCLTNHTIGRDRSNIITTNWHYHQRLCLKAWHINSTHTPLNHDDGSLLPIYTSSEKGQLISEHMKGPCCSRQLFLAGTVLYVYNWFLHVQYGGHIPFTKKFKYYYFSNNTKKSGKWD